MHFCIGGLVAGVEQLDELGIDAGRWALVEAAVFGGREHDGHILLIVADQERLLMGFCEQGGQLEPSGDRNCLHVRSVPLIVAKVARRGNKSFVVVTWSDNSVRKWTFRHMTGQRFAVPSRWKLRQRNLFPTI